MFNPFENVSIGDDESDLFAAFSQVQERLRQAAVASSRPSGARRGVEPPHGSKSKSLPEFKPSGQSGQGVASAGSIGIASLSGLQAVSQNSSQSFEMKAPASSGGSKREAFDRTSAARRAGFDGRGVAINERDDRFAKVKAGGGAMVVSGFSSALPMAVGQSDSGFSVSRNVTPFMRATALAGGAQACVVKLVSTGGGRGSASAMIAYNGRDGKEPIERENGELVLSREDVSEMLNEWEQFFDKREPSKDVMTLTVRFESGLSDIEQAAFKAAVEEAYKDQRLVSGFGVDDAGQHVFVAVVSIASKGSGRIKTTDHARDLLQVSVEGAQEPLTPKAVFALSDASHGIEGLEHHLKRALVIVPTLSGPKDTLIDQKTVSRSAARWSEDLRSYGNRDVMHLVISSKAGTDEKAFVNAARDFLGAEFGNHKYAFALHGPNDSSIDKKSGQSKATDHVHVHAMIVMKGMNGDKLNPRIQDFKRWRETMATHARAHGIDMVATNRTENLNAVNFTKGEHELVKLGVAPTNIVAKVGDKQADLPVAPRHSSGMLNAQIGKSVFTQLVQNSHEAGNQPIALEAARMAKRFDAAFRSIDGATAAVKPTGNFDGLNKLIQDLANMLNSNLQKDDDMASRQSVIAKVELLAAKGAAISESLRGDPALKQEFDKNVLSKVTALKSLGDKSKTSQDMSEAVRSRTLQAQAIENATALERQAGASKDVDVRNDKSGAARDNRAVAARAGSAASSAEMSLRAGGVATQPIGEAARQVIAADTIRPDIETPQQTPTEKPNVKSNDRPRGRGR